MRKLILGRTNQYVSAISLGAWAHGGANTIGNLSVGWAGQHDKDSISALLLAWESGINHWDTADVYGEGKSEKLIGSLWGAIPRHDIFLATKVGWDKGPYSYWYNPKHMMHNINRSLTNLKTDYIDLLYLHHCNFGRDDEHFENALDTIQKVQSEGKIKFIGLSDWSNKKIYKYIKKVNPDVIQPYRNVMDDEYKVSGLQDYVNKNNLGVCFFSPIKHGLLTGKYNKPPSFDIGDFRSGVKEFNDKNMIDKMIKNKNLLQKRFPNHSSPVMYGIINALFNNVPTGCVLLGQRNTEQVTIASTLGDNMSQEDSDWVKSLYSL